MHRILVVDDDATLAMEFEEFLPSVGCKVEGMADFAKDVTEQAMEHH